MHSASTRCGTARVDKRVRSTVLYHSGQCGIMSYLNQARMAPSFALSWRATAAESRGRKEETVQWRQISLWQISLRSPLVTNWSCFCGLSWSAIMPCKHKQVARRVRWLPGFDPINRISQGILSKSSQNS